MSAPSLADLKAHVEVTGPEEDSALSLALEAAISFVGRETGLYLDRVERTTYLTIRGAGATSIDFAQDVDVSLVETLDASAVVSGYAPLAVGSWELRGRSVIRLPSATWGGGTRWPGGRHAVRITYTAGYDDDHPMPSDLRLAILDFAATTFRGRRVARPMTMDEPGAGETTPRMPPTFWATIKGYRMVPGF